MQRERHLPPANPFVFVFITRTIIKNILSQIFSENTMKAPYSLVAVTTQRGARFHRAGAAAYRQDVTSPDDDLTS